MKTRTAGFTVLLFLIFTILLAGGRDDDTRPDPTVDQDAFCQWCLEKYNELHHKLLEYEHIDLAADFDQDGSLMMVPLSCKFADGSPDGIDLSHDPQACKEYINQHRAEIKNLTWVEERPGYPGTVFRLVGKNVYEDWCRKRKGSNWKRFYDNRVRQSRALMDHIRNKYGSVFKMREEEQALAEDWNLWCKDWQPPEEKKEGMKKPEPKKTKKISEEEERNRWFQEQLKPEKKPEPKKHTGPRYSQEQIRKMISLNKTLIESLKRSNEKSKKSHMYNKAEDDIYRRTIRAQVKRNEQDIIRLQQEIAKLMTQLKK